MALGATLFSMPAAFLGSLSVSLLNGFDPAQSLAAYSVFGAIFLLTFFFINGFLRD